MEAEWSLGSTRPAGRAEVTAAWEREMERRPEDEESLRECEVGVDLRRGRKGSRVKGRGGGTKSAFPAEGVGVREELGANTAKG